MNPWREWMMWERRENDEPSTLAIFPCPFCATKFYHYVNRSCFVCHGHGYYLGEYYHA